MPKLPRGTGKATTKERAKTPAAKPAAATKRAPAKKANGGSSATATKKKPAPTRSNGARAKAKPKAPERDFRHRPVDRADQHAPVGPKTKLSDDQRVLLGDLFAVVEEHAGESNEEVNRELVERAFVFSCERHADQRRASGEDFIVHPIGVAKICAGMRLDTATLCAALLHD